MFWGLVLEPSKRYTQKVQQSFHVSQAALELNTADLEPIQLILEYDGANYVLATLSRKLNLYQVPLDLNFNVGDQISFRTIGKGRVHLTGYHILEDDLDAMGLNDEEESEVEEETAPEALENSLVSGGKRKKQGSDRSKKAKKSKLSGKNEAEASEDESDEDEDEEEPSLGDLSDSEDEEDEDEDEIESDNEDEDGDEENDDEESEDEDEEDEKTKKKSPASAKGNKSDVGMNGKTPKNKKLNESLKSASKPAKKNTSTPAKETKENKTPKSEKSVKGEKKDQSNQELSPQKKVVEGGVIIEELKVGEGQVAKPGKMVQVYYVGRLQSNKKQFDATTQGPGFKFRLGKGEVIRGWDIGVNGMKVGGKRRITIPSQLAYGAKGAPPAIPPNSVLVFEVELKNVN